jgi:transcriptional regulator GlxA family with amidase domain
MKAFLMVCTASLAVAQTGILDGHAVCSNKWVLRGLAGAGLLNRKVKWIGDRRWHVDGKIWSSAGITAGLDLAAEFARQHFDPEIVQIAKDLSEYESNAAQPDPFARLLEGVDLS